MLDLLITAESLYFEPPREMKIGLKNRRVQELITVEKLQLENYSVWLRRGNDFRFKLSQCLKKWEFEKSGLVLSLPICHVIGAWSGGCAITGAWFELFVTGYPHDFHVSYLCINGFLHYVFYSFQNSRRVLQMFSQKKFSKVFLMLKFVIDRD